MKQENMNNTTAAANEEDILPTKIIGDIEVNLRENTVLSHFNFTFNAQAGTIWIDKSTAANAENAQFMEDTKMKTLKNETKNFKFAGYDFIKETFAYGIEYYFDGELIAEIEVDENTLEPTQTRTMLLDGSASEWIPTDDGDDLNLVEDWLEGFLPEIAEAMENDFAEY